MRAVIDRRSQEGASAVEFALLFPLFLLLVFGMVSAGQAYARKISITQAAREGSRFGSTLPIPPQPGQSIDDWLTSVLDASVGAGGTDLSTTTPVDGQWVCVAYVAGATGSQPTKRLVMDSGGATSASSSRCWDDTGSGVTQARVQVEIRRATDWNLLIVDPTVLTLESRSVTQFERAIP